MNWISLSEQRPDYEVPILVCLDGQIAIARLITETRGKGGVCYNFVEGTMGNGNFYATPTHWMPLPEPATLPTAAKPAEIAPV